MDDDVKEDLRALFRCLDLKERDSEEGEFRVVSIRSVRSDTMMEMNAALARLRKRIDDE